MFDLGNQWEGLSPRFLIFLDNILFLREPQTYELLFYLLTKYQCQQPLTPLEIVLCLESVLSDNMGVWLPSCHSNSDRLCQTQSVSLFSRGGHNNLAQ